MRKRFEDFSRRAVEAWLDHLAQPRVIDLLREAGIRRHEMNTFAAAWQLRWMDEHADEL